ncbi:MAG: hypothetical protein WA172_19280 [Terriglobales bacterium]
MPVKKQLKKAVKGLFDFPTLMAHLNADDPLALLLRGHLYVEAALIKQIEAVIVDRKAFDGARLPFHTKVKFGVALGKVSAADVGGFVALNDLRNKFAHNVATKLTKQDEENLYNALSPIQRKMIKEPRKAEAMFLRRLRFDIMGLIANAAC